MRVPGGSTVERPPPERLILLFGIVVGVPVAILSAGRLLSGPELDFHAYYFAGRAVLRGEPFVGWAITDGTFLTRKAYVYMPITAPLFAVYALFPQWYVPYAIHAGVLLAAFYAVGRINVRYVETHGRALDRADRWLILGFCMFSGPAVLGLYRGNVDPAILLLIAVGFLAVERGREATGGALWAVAAMFKLFPAFLGVWLLYRRAYRGVAAALGVGIGATLLSVGVFGFDVHVEFVEFILHERSREGAFVGGLSPTLMWITLRRPLSHVLPLSGNQLTLVALALIAPFLYPLYRRADSELARLCAFFATFIALLITVIPLTAGYVIYLLFPLVALAYLAERPVVKGCFLAGLVLINVPLYPPQIRRILAAFPLSSGAVNAVMDVASSVLAVTSIGLWAFLLPFAGCFLYVRASDGETR